MGLPLRLLVVDDSEVDCLLVLRELRRSGYDLEFRQVETFEGMSAELESLKPEIVICDYGMPRFSAPAALRMVQERGLDIPFIVVSGTIGEHTAVEMMKAGAHDYIMKGNITRLGAAVQRELRDAFIRAERNHAHAVLRETNLELKKAQEVAQFKSKFLANMSHELRTPLNAIIGFSELLAQELFGPLLPRQKEYVQNIATSGEHLLSLVNDILDIARIEAGRMELARDSVPISEILETVERILQPLAEKKRVRLEISLAPALPNAYVDPIRIKQVLYNLITNGIKFTAAGGWVRVAAVEEGSNLRLTVEDTGIGIAKEDISRLFQPFEQLHPNRAGDGTPGTGLGLALTKSLVEMHGGTITVHSEVGKGSVFTLNLPVLNSSRASRPSATEELPS